MRQLLLLLLAASSVRCGVPLAADPAARRSALSARRSALYLLGDSTHARLYETLIGFCKGENDARALRPLEAVRCASRRRAETELQLTPPSSSYDFKGRTCSDDAPFSRLGYYLHWGVGEPPYHLSWMSHRIANDTLNSVDNILAAVTEFQHRSVEEARVIFLFVSNLWDVRRYTDHFYATLPVPGMVAQQRADLRAAAMQIQARMRAGQDELLLQTCHLPQDPDIVTYVDALNANALEVARNLSLPLLDEAALVGSWVNRTEDDEGVKAACPREYLGWNDGVHQSLESNLLIAAQLELYTRTGSSPAVLRPVAEGTATRRL